MLYNVPILTSVYVQVPEDAFCFLLGAGMHKARRDFYWMVRGGIKTMRRLALSRIYSCSLIAARRALLLAIVSRSSHRQPGGLGNWFSGWPASGMGNNRGVFLSPSFPSLGLRRNLYQK